MMNAAAPMTGGIICPPVDATASTAPAKCGSYPTLFMRGIVNMPVVQTFATDEPETVPIRPELTTATFAGPPVDQPARESERSMMNLPSPVFSSTAPKRINIKTNVEDTSSGVPKIPSVPRYIWFTMRATLKPRCAITAGIYRPK